MKRMLVDQQDITRTRLEEVAPAPLKPGEARLRLQSFALTANNVTYAATGFVIGYWKFFPSGVEGQGLVPVWGTAEVFESASDVLQVGQRLYGFYPLAEAMVMVPAATKGATIEDAAPHRAQLPAVYNRYVPVEGTAPRQDHLRALLQPLLATSWLLSDWLADNDHFGAEQVIVGSASSKTGLGLCKYLAEDAAHPVQIIGLTSEGNREFVEGLQACDHVLSYEEIDQLAEVPSVYVDMAGNAAVKRSLHERLADHLTHLAAVGTSHWDQFAPQQDLPGVKPQFFFAPSQIAKRREDWGPGVVERNITEAWARVADGAADWMELHVHDGLAAALPVYADLAAGRASPKDGHVIALK